MSTTVTKDILTNQTFNQQSFKNPHQSQTDRFSINSNDMEEGIYKNKKLKGRASEYSKHAKLMCSKTAK